MVTNIIAHKDNWLFLKSIIAIENNIYENIFIIISKYEDFNPCIYNALGSIRSPKTRKIYKSRKLEKQNKAIIIYIIIAKYWATSKKNLT